MFNLNTQLFEIGMKLAVQKILSEYLHDSVIDFESYQPRIWSEIIHNFLGNNFTVNKFIGWFLRSNKTYPGVILTYTRGVCV